MVRPRSLAVFRLITSSNLLGCSMGRSPGLAPLENLVHVGRGAPKQIRLVRSIGDKAPGIDKLPRCVHCRQPVLGRQVHEASMLSEEHGAWQHSQSTRARAGHVREGPGEFVRTLRLIELRLYPSARAAQ